MAEDFDPCILAGDGITLSLFRTDDVEELNRIINENRDYLAGWLNVIGNPSTRNEVHQFIRNNQNNCRDALSENYRSHPGFELAIRMEGEVVGMIGYQGIHWLNRLTALGYWVVPAHQGKGIVTKSCSALVNYTYRKLKLNRIEIQCAEDNPASMGVPERLGFHHEALLAEVEKRGEDFVSHHLYRMLRRDWEK